MFLNRPALSLETHLGVTTSPHVPFPTGFVTLPVHSRSPPFRLSLFRSEKWVADSSFLRFVRLHSTHVRASVMSSMPPPKAGRTITDITRPHLVGTFNTQAPQKVGINLMPLSWLTGSRLRVNGPEPHLSHQALDALTIHLLPPLLKLSTQATAAIEPPFQIELVKFTHRINVCR